MTETSSDGRLDRAVTLGGYGKGGGQIDPSARTTYARMWGRFDRWCSSHGRRSIPASSETLAEFCLWFTQDAGYAVATAEVACTAVRWRHRIAGETPPDRVAAWYVLRKSHATGRTGHTRPFRAACRDDMAQVAEVCDLATAAGLRDLAAVALPYALGIGDGTLAGLRLEALEFHPGSRPDEIRVDLQDAAPAAAQLPGWCWQTLACRGDRGEARATPPWHPGNQPRRAGAAGGCPTCVLHLWRAMLTGQGITSGPLIRPVDAYGNVAGAAAHAGSVSATYAMRPEPVRQVIGRAMRRADLDEPVTHRPVTSLRIGAAVQARKVGAGQAEVAARAGYHPQSLRLARYLADADLTETQTRQVDDS